MRPSVVVLSHKPGDWLRLCLESVAGQADEIVLVDNGSDGGAASAVGKSVGACVLRSDTNLGYAAGVNLGVRRSKGDLIALLNDDAVADPDWLSNAAVALQREDVAAVVPKVVRSGWFREVRYGDAHDAPGDHRVLGRMVRSVTSDGRDVLDRLLGWGIYELERASDDDGCWRWTRPGAPFYVPVAGHEGGEVLVDGEPAPPGPVCRLLNKAGGYLMRDGILGDIGDETPDDGRWDTPSEPFFGSGTAMVMRRETFERVGPLAEPFFAYYEDSDWCWRARLAGLRVVYDPTSTVEHRHSATMGDRSPVAARLANRNRLLTMIRNAPLRELPGAAKRARSAARNGHELVDIALKIPWALRSRRGYVKEWKTTPSEVWERWAGAGTEWDRSPCRE